MASTETYLSLITSLYREQPKFIALCEALVRPLVDVQNLLLEIRDAFDLDSAVGVQLDATGLWVGRSRDLETPLAGVYFSWNESGVGWGEGTWKGPYDPATGITSLQDDFFRLLLRAKIAANSWDGTTAGAREIWNQLFSASGMMIVQQDCQDMSMIVGVAGVVPDAVFKALLTGGYLPLKPVGVRIRYYALPVVAGALFGWDCDSEAVSGWGAGWPEIITS
ncbi:DUF2612 domain-containing protein [Pseudodesulfovibrio sp.]|uniref:DUF2612 domain-containing protein n=1 Tax=Pseudodesulfovibrio sp. TaxID=2035812 RepID=UPI00260E456A|nr:DUF2612 domain-containing protein [Pseudodesulfovibrio sp.]MDD3310942.1 DUF2612 domain-containing protein [Pseudodesulfovibrio sp.]